MESPVAAYFNLVKLVVVDSLGPVQIGSNNWLALLSEVIFIILQICPTKAGSIKRHVLLTEGNCSFLTFQVTQDWPLYGAGYDGFFVLLNIRLADNLQPKQSFFARHDWYDRVGLIRQLHFGAILSLK